MPLYRVYGLPLPAILLVALFVAGCFPSAVGSFPAIGKPESVETAASLTQALPSPSVQVSADMGTIPTTTPTPTVEATATPPSDMLITPTPSGQSPAAVQSVAEIPRETAQSAKPFVPSMAPLVRGDSNQRRLALTFDAGAGRGSAEQLLDALKDNGVKATFFLTGAWIERNQDLTQRIAAEGHELANHSYSHPRFTQISDQEIIEELERTEQLCQAIAQASCKPFFRPPYGAYDGRVLALVTEAGYQTVYWTFDSADWRPEMSADDIYRRVTRLAAPGAIIVFHISPDTTATATPQIIRTLGERGYTFVTLGEMAGG